MRGIKQNWLVFEVHGQHQERVKRWETVLGHIPIVMYIALASTGCKQTKEQWGKYLQGAKKLSQLTMCFCLKRT